LQLISDKDAFEKEKQLLLKNTSIGGTEKGVSVAELKLAADFYRSRMKEVNGELLKLDTRISEFQAVSNRLQRELREFNISGNRPTGEIIILLQADSKVVANIDLRYVVSDAGWAPFYELKAEDISKPITLVYRARAFNNSGIDWSDVKIKLSTSDPTRSASKPTMYPWLLNFNARVYRSDRYIDHGSGQGNVQYLKSQINNQNLENQSTDKQQLNEVEMQS